MTFLEHLMAMLIHISGSWHNAVVLLLTGACLWPCICKLLCVACYCFCAASWYNFVKFYIQMCVLIGRPVNLSTISRPWPCVWAFLSPRRHVLGVSLLQHSWAKVCVCGCAFVHTCDCVSQVLCIAIAISTCGCAKGGRVLEGIYVDKCSSPRFKSHNS